MKAVFNNKTIAESYDTVIVENNHYFPISDVNMDYLKRTGTKSVCSWKGDASYYDVVVNEKTAKDAAWEYQEPKEKAQEIKGKIAFWNGVEVIE